MGTAADEGAGDDVKVVVGDGGCDTTGCDSPMDALPLVAGGWLLGSVDESFWP